MSDFIVLRRVRFMPDAAMLLSFCFQLFQDVSSNGIRLSLAVLAGMVRVKLVQTTASFMY